MAVKWIQLGIDSHPQHLGIAAVVRPFKKIECFFRTTELAGHECEVVGRNVTTLGQEMHVIQHGLGLIEISGSGVSASEPSERMRCLAHQLDALLGGMNRLSVTAE